MGKWKYTEDREVRGTWQTLVPLIESWSSTGKGVCCTNDAPAPITHYTRCSSQIYLLQLLPLTKAICRWDVPHEYANFLAPLSFHCVSQALSAQTRLPVREQVQFENNEDHHRDRWEGKTTTERNYCFHTPTTSSYYMENIKECNGIPPQASQLFYC